MTAKEKAKLEIKKLVQRFDEHYSEYKDTKYSETPTRRDFIDPFFKALGWDIDNQGSMAEAYREVIHEDKVKISGQLKSPDYSFRFEGKRYFFVEAKKPSVNIKEDSNPAYQVKRYAWSAQLKISIVTDFEEFAVYDCTNKPKPSDKVTQSRIHYFTYKDYINKFDYIWDTFSRDAVVSGGYDKYVESEAKKGASSVDKEFLVSLDSWRVKLAKDIFSNNPKINEDQLNFLVQHAIDRIIFLRIAEDRNVEMYGSIQNCAKTKNVYKALFKLFQNADDKYNSGLFDFKKDVLSPQIKISDECLGDIISDLYLPICPYEFSVMPVEILGSAYEQFLGKTIQITDSGKIKIEEKIEVRKAGGVYYTPQYIVEYIVRKTLGVLIEGKTPNQIEKIKILDPSSGSGSFLIGAYQYLLDYHLRWYRKNKVPSKGKKDEPLNPDGSLKTDIKKKILLNNIFGVDLDANAVEVTKLSLLLKCLEGETQASINAQLSLFHERVLPTLDDNIRCGNSLVETDYFEMEADGTILKKVKPFSWRRAFPTIFKNGGFDIIIGNPPWGAYFTEEVLDYLRDKNSKIIVRMIDSFMYFLNLSLKINKKGGLVGMILPDVLLYQIDNWKLRKLLIEETKIQKILNMGNVFVDVIRPTSIIVFENDQPNRNVEVNTLDLSALKSNAEKSKKLVNVEKYEICKQSSLSKIENYLFVTNNLSNYSVIDKIKKLKVLPLADFIDEDGIQRGVSPDYKEAFIVSSQIIKKHGLEKNKLRPTLTGGIHVKRYKITYPDLSVIYTTREDDFKTLPNIKAYIDGFKKEITCKEVVQKKHPLYALHRPREKEIFEKDTKVVGVITEDEIVVSIDNKKTYPTDGIYLFAAKRGVDVRYLLGILNSKLFIFLYRLVSMEEGRVMAQVKPTIISTLPIVDVYSQNKSTAKKQDSINEVKKQAHDKIIKHVDQILGLNQSENRNSEQLSHLVFEVDKLVYDLYGLSADEIKVVEEAVDGSK